MTIRSGTHQVVLGRTSPGLGTRLVQYSIGLLQVCSLAAALLTLDFFLIIAAASRLGLLSDVYTMGLEKLFVEVTAAI